MHGVQCGTAWGSRMTVITLPDGSTFGWGRGLGKGMLTELGGFYLALFCTRSMKYGRVCLGRAYRQPLTASVEIKLPVFGPGWRV